MFQVARPTLPNGRRPLTFFFNSIFANFAPCVSSRALSFISVTAAAIFQMLELSVCMIVDFLQNGDRHSLSQCEKCPHFGGIYRLGSYSNTMPMCSIWLQYHPPPGKSTAVKITGQEKEDKVKKSRHHMEFVNKSSDVFWIGQEITLKFMVVLHGCRCPHMLGHLTIWYTVLKSNTKYTVCINLV